MCRLTLGRSADDPSAGYYEAGAFGIRLENVMVVQKAKTEHAFGEQAYLCFQRVTLVPFQRELIVVELLSDEELKWVNNYHAEVEREIGPRLQAHPETRAWLKAACAPILREGHHEHPDKLRKIATS